MSGQGSGSIGVWDLWSESVKETETLSDPFFLECLEAASSSRVFEDLGDDKLKASLGIINSHLNDPKTRAKGLTLLNDLSMQVNPSRLVGYQDAITSALHLVVKGLDSPLASSVLVNFLPKFHSLTEVNQIVTSAIVPKALAHFCAGGKDSAIQKSVEGLELLKICLVEYHGPCGQFREKLERSLVHFIDSENKEAVELVKEVFPLLSYAGGGGNAGEKHSKDWTIMLNKFLQAAYSTLYELYGDGGTNSTLEPENPFDGDCLLGYKKILETNVLLRMSILKRRLLNILTILTGYLGSSFPAPKVVPLKGILNLLQCLISVNPAALEKSNLKGTRKETVYVSAIAPGIHIGSLDLLQSVFSCVGSNAFVYGTVIEQLITSEFKWLQERPNAFENVKIQLYETLGAWLTMTGGIVTNSKTLSLWVNAIGCDTRVEKDVVELKVLSKPKSGKSVLKPKSLSTASLSINPASVSAETSQTYVQKSSKVCLIALKILMDLIPGLDGDNHRKIYEHLLKTATILNKFDMAPPPFKYAPCRLYVFEALTKLAYCPHRQSPVSLNLIVSLLRHGVLDTTRLVSSFCTSQIANLERLMHPISAPLALAGTAPIPVILDNQPSSRVIPLVDEDDEMDETVDNTVNSNVDVNQEYSREHQTFDISTSNNDNTTLPVNLKDLESIIKKSVENVLRDHAITPPMLSPANPKRLVRTSRVIMSSFNSEIEKVVDEVEISDDASIVGNESTLVNPPSINGNSSSSEDELNVSDNDDLERINGNAGDVNGSSLGTSENVDNVGLKRKNESSEDDFNATGNEITGELFVKKVKTSSPSKIDTATAVDGPSVQEMMQSFVDLDADVP